MFDRRSKTEEARKPGAARRLKTYSAESGFVYEYVFVAEAELGRYQFDISWDRKSFHRITIQIDPGVLRQAAGRELTTVERYAVAKIALRHALDECDAPETMLPPLTRPDRDRLAEILVRLDLL